jgi:hypothetical protein
MPPTAKTVEAVEYVGSFSIIQIEDGLILLAKKNALEHPIIPPPTMQTS